MYNFCLPKEELLNTTADPGFFANGPSGVLNITAVAPGHVPLFVSKPHFLDADPDYLANVSGLHPNRAEHDSYVGVEPITGNYNSHELLLSVCVCVCRCCAGCCQEAPGQLEAHTILSTPALPSEGHHYAACVLGGSDWEDTL